MFVFSLFYSTMVSHNLIVLYPSAILRGNTSRIYVEVSPARNFHWSDFKKPCWQKLCFSVLSNSIFIKLIDENVLNICIKSVYTVTLLRTPQSNLIWIKIRDGTRSKRWAGCIWENVLELKKNTFRKSAFWVDEFSSGEGWWLIIHIFYFCSFLTLWLELEVQSMSWKRKYFTWMKNIKELEVHCYLTHQKWVFSMKLLFLDSEKRKENLSKKVFWDFFSHLKILFLQMLIRNWSKYQCKS